MPKKKMVKPNFLVVGAAKAGSTSLYYYLKQNPAIEFSSLKEPKYFSSHFLTFPHNGIGDTSVDKYAIKDWDSYLECFSKLNNFKRVGEVSPDYLFYHEKTAPFIKEKLGDIPIIIILRNPVKRAFSAYSYLKRDNREKLDFSHAMEAEEKRRNQNFDFIWAYKQGGCYYEQILTFKNTFKNVKVVLFEDLISNPLDVTNEIFKFINVSPLGKLSNEKHNPSGLPNNPLAKFILNRNNKISTGIREVLKNITPRIILERVASKSLNKLHIKKTDEEYLKNYYRRDIQKLETLIEKDLSIWKI